MEDSLSAGFSSNTKTVSPVITDGAFGYHNVNVDAEEKDASSLLNWMIKMIHLRKNIPAISFGNWNFIKTNNEHVIAIHYDWNGSSIITIHNLSNDAQQTELNFEDNVDEIKSMLNNNQQKADRNKIKLQLQGYGYDWYKIISLK